MNFTTKGMTMEERYESFENGNIVPIGTICYRAGDWLENTKQEVVDESNQKIISMLWNCQYYDNKEDADIEMNKSKASYYAWLFSKL